MITKYTPFRRLWDGLPTIPPRPTEGLLLDVPFTKQSPSRAHHSPLYHQSNTRLPTNTANLEAPAPGPWLATLTRHRGQRTERLFWQTGGGYDRNITCGQTLLRMIDYLHNNPVRRGLVERARDWKWSSAAAIEGGPSTLVIDTIPWDWLADA